MRFTFPDIVSNQLTPVWADFLPTQFLLIDKLNVFLGSLYVWHYFVCNISDDLFPGVDAGTLWTGPCWQLLDADVGGFSTLARIVWAWLLLPPLLPSAVPVAWTRKSLLLGCRSFPFRTVEFSGYHGLWPRRQFLSRDRFGACILLTVYVGDVAYVAVDAPTQLTSMLYLPFWN